MQVVYAIDTFIYEHGRIDAGTVWPADDPVVKARPGKFSADPLESPGFRRSPGVPRGVEQATAAPGERRTVRRGK